MQIVEDFVWEEAKTGWSPGLHKYSDYPPMHDRIAPCVDCGTVVVFRHYWERVREGYMPQSHGWCGGCKRQVHTRPDGTQKSRGELTTCVCGAAKSAQSKRCRTCNTKQNPKEIRTSVCQYRYCGQEFTWDEYLYLKDPDGGWRKQPRKYCSQRCSRNEHKALRYHREKAKPGGYKRKQFKRNAALAIAFEHAYLCGICGDLIDVSLPQTHAKSLTIDHIIAVINGGTDDPANLRPAHRGCNGSKSGAEDQRLGAV